MIAVIEFTDKKTGEKRLLEVYVVGHHDAQRVLKDYRKVSKAKLRLKSLREK